MLLLFDVNIESKCRMIWAPIKFISHDIICTRCLNLNSTPEMSIQALDTIHFVPFFFLSLYFRLIAFYTVKRCSSCFHNANESPRKRKIHDWTKRLRESETEWQRKKAELLINWMHTFGILHDVNVFVCFISNLWARIVWFYRWATIQYIALLMQIQLNRILVLLFL